MEFNLAYIKNTNQVLVRSFKDGEEADKGKIFDIAELKENPVQGIFFKKDYIETEQELMATLEKESLYSPLRPTTQEWLDYDQFETLSLEQAKQYFNKVHPNWVLQNNLKLLKEIFKVTKHMKALWPNDRTTFFEELWSILKSNLGAHELKIFFNHLEKDEKENSKNKLIRIKVEGKRVPNPSEAGDLGTQMMENYQGRFNQPIDIVEFDEGQGNLVALGSINGSPCVIIAKVYQLGPIQKTLIESLFDGLQND